MRKRFGWLAAAGLLLVGAGSVRADLLPIVNAGFEADFAAPGTFPVGPVTGWDLLDPNGIVDFTSDAVGVLNPTEGTFFPGGAPEGNNVALIFLGGDIGGGTVSLRQILTSVLEPNTRYTLSVAVGNIASGTGSPPFDVFGFFDLDGFPGYAVQLLAGGVVIAEDNNGLFGSIPEGEFAESSSVVNIGAAHPQLGQPLEIRLTNLNVAETPENPGIEVDFDNVRLDATSLRGVSAPEPSSLALLALMGGLAGMRGRKKR